MLSFLALTLVWSAPLLLAAMGGYTSERGGVINIGLEGMMLGAAVLTALISPRFGIWPGLLAGITAATVLALIHWLATQKYGIDHVISGMAVNALAAGGSNFVWGKFGEANTGFQHAPIWLFCTLAIASPLILATIAKKTKAGLRLLAVGADPEKSRLMGLQPSRIRLYGLLSTGLFTGLAGAMLVSDTETFTDNMTAGRGYIALAALIVGGWRPIPTAAICLSFGLLNAIQLQFQGTATLAFIPSQAWAALPYIATILAIAGFLGKNRTPSGLGKA
ncbi:guanosine ABC transporter permease NupQ [soil metagenome]